MGQDLLDLGFRDIVVVDIRLSRRGIDVVANLHP
jgi:hypothetical protein